ncbi:MAG TPA: hypothetical protein VHT24_09170 [Pseudacidobacterium sp.]|nr:hypothetical protein [Pseudacidobacterium sp.]
MRWRIVTCVAAMGSTLVFAQNGTGHDITVQGWVLDSACAYTKGLDKPISADCARACAKNGSPLVILRDDGTIFVPIDDKTPAASQNPRLLPFAGQKVTVLGVDYVRNGSHALVIRTIEPIVK